MSELRSLTIPVEVTAEDCQQGFQIYPRYSSVAIAINRALKDAGYCNYLCSVSSDQVDIYHDVLLPSVTDQELWSSHLKIGAGFVPPNQTCFELQIYLSVDSP